MNVYIMYGGPDEAIAQFVSKYLDQQGIESFFFPKSKIPGQRLSNTMLNKIKDTDRAILICSSASLNRPGVQTEIQLGFDREAAEGGAEYIIPFLIEEDALKSWQPMNQNWRWQLENRGYVVATDIKNKRALRQDVERLCRPITEIKELIPVSFINDIDALDVGANRVRWRFEKTYKVAKSGALSCYFGIDPSPGKMSILSASINGADVTPIYNHERRDFSVTSPDVLRKGSILSASVTVEMIGAFENETFIQSTPSEKFKNFSYAIRANGFVEIKDASGIASGRTNIPVKWSSSEAAFSISPKDRTGSVGIRWRWEI